MKLAIAARARARKPAHAHSAPRTSAGSNVSFILRRERWAILPDNRGRNVVARAARARREGSAHERARRWERRRSRRGGALIGRCSARGAAADSVGAALLVHHGAPRQQLNERARPLLVSRIVVAARRPASGVRQHECAARSRDRHVEEPTLLVAVRVVRARERAAVARARQPAARLVVLAARARREAAVVRADEEHDVPLQAFGLVDRAERHAPSSARGAVAVLLEVSRSRRREADIVKEARSALGEARRRGGVAIAAANGATYDVAAAERFMLLRAIDI